MKRFLIVEDDQTLGALTKQKLVDRGYIVTYQSTVSDALVVIDGNQFDLVILDLLLDGETSLKLIQPIVKNNPSAKILMLTGFASIATAVEAVKLGAHNYLPKPATISEILDALDESEAINNEQPEENKISDVLSPRRLEWEHIQRVLHKNNGNISATARELKMHRRTLQRKLQKNPVRG